MAADKVEAVKKVTETVTKQSNSAQEMERLSPNKEQFDSLMNSSKAINPTSFERIDNKAFNVEEVQNIETKPVFAEENVSSQKSGSATDQQKKRHQQEETEEVEGVGATRSKSATTSQSTSLMDEVSKLNQHVSNASGNPEDFKAQAKETIAQIENVKTKLSQVQTEIKPSYQTLLRNRLTHIDDNLKIALNKAGVEYTPPPVSSAKDSNPIQKFIGFLTNSQKQIENLNVSVDGLSGMGQINPIKLLAIQMKLHYVQQQVELFTNLLNKALESTKTIMNVQV